MQINAALVAYSVVSHYTGIQQFDKEWTRHAKHISRSLRRNHLVIRNESEGPAVRHEPHRLPENLEDAAGKFDSFPGLAYQGGYATMQHSLQSLYLLLLSIRGRDRFLDCNRHDIFSLAHTRNTRNTRNIRPSHNADLSLERTMQGEQIHDALEAHWRASAAGDVRAEHYLYADDAIGDYPQSGERILGRRNLEALRSHHPSKPSGFDVRRILGQGNLWITEYTISMVSMCQVFLQ